MRSLIPAYGRDYTKQADILAAWDAGKDFRDVNEGCYLNRADAEALHTMRVKVRYAKQTKALILWRTEKGWRIA